MLNINYINIIVTIILTIIIFICLVGMVLASKFQRKKDKKYKELVRIIKEKENATFKVKDGLSDEEIKAIDNNIDPSLLMQELYNTFLSLMNKEKELDSSFDDILTGTLKEVYENKINSSKEKKKYEITTGIELISYSIIDFNNDVIDFRININCFHYKMSNNTIVSGSNLEKVEQVLIITYKKINDKWLISKIEKPYEAQLHV